MITNKDFWKKIKPALTDTNPSKQSDIILKEGEDLISDDNLLSKTFNNQYVNIVEISTGSAPTTLGNIDITNNESMKDYINKMISNYENHPSIKMIQEQIPNMHLANVKIPSANI